MYGVTKNIELKYRIILCSYIGFGVSLLLYG